MATEKSRHETEVHNQDNGPTMSLWAALHELSSKSKISEQDIHHIEHAMEAVLLAIYAHPQWMDLRLSAPPKILYYAADFIVRTGTDYIMQLDLDKVNAGDKDAGDMYKDILSRNMVIAMILKDKTGKMQETLAPGEERIEFGDEIKENAQKLLNTIFDDWEDVEEKDGDASVS